MISDIFYKMDQKIEKIKTNSYIEARPIIRSIVDEMMNEIAEMYKNSED
jgi:hypothetical protein